MTGTDKYISELPSDISYHRLNNWRYFGYKDQNFWDDIEEKLKKYHSISNICEVLLKGFYVASYLEESKTLYRERWDYLYFWAGVKIFDKLDNSSNFKEIMNILNEIRKKFDNNSMYNYDVSEITKQQFTNLKEIYDFVHDYEVIESKLLPVDFKCTIKFKDHIENSYNVYNHEKIECTGRYGQYCATLNKIINTKNNLTKPLCTDVEREETPVRDSHQLLEAQSEDNGSDGQSLGSEDSTSAPSAGIGIPIGLTLFGFLLIFFVLYKFSPLGTVLHAHFLRNKIIRQYINNDKSVNGWLKKTYEYENENSANSRHHIGYNII
ncbi:PIR Superfamily Protein [Plasmodium ovale curtisi]|uniref:PIR Superfamily Protein n=1 Tax=Plasmodium ovale curtisi TaxID=864141 RepID=A0A1A8VNL4_PLAOA|nr:PIR Superfamily Protein [Plasmodium ovale curtisi]